MDNDVKEKCASKGGVCRMDWKGKGYSCCPEGSEEDENGGCKGKL